jgi:hypothetical protein
MRCVLSGMFQSGGPAVCACSIHPPITTNLVVPDRLTSNCAAEGSAKRACAGYRPVHIELRREGWCHGQNKTRRIYRELGLQLRNKTLSAAPRQSCRRIVGRYPLERDLSYGLRA